MKIYTRTGDEGTTSSLSGEKFRKNDTIIDCIGAADEAITSIERIRLYIKEQPKIQKDIEKIIDGLYQLMAELSNGKASGLTKTIQQGYIDRLERRIDELQELNGKPKGFVFFETIQGLDTSEARVRVRRLERKLTPLLRHEVIRSVVYKYVNRLSDYLFVLAVYLDNKEE